LRGQFGDGTFGGVTIKGIYLNAVWASHRQTYSDTFLGTSSGTPNELMRFSQSPVLAAEHIEIRELIGARANVEWRIVARELGDETIVRELEELIGREGLKRDITKGDLHLRLGPGKKIVEVWVRWLERPHFLESKPDDRHYIIDRVRGIVFFGNGTRGKIPPAGAAVQAREFHSGGGQAGNVPRDSISQLLAAVPVQKVRNPRSAEGGSDGETLAAFSVRAPKTVRHRGRAVTAADYEAMALEASPAVAVARVSAGSGAGSVKLRIIPHSLEAQPIPSFGLLEQVRRYLITRAPAELAGARRIEVSGPQYSSVNVDATVSPLDPEDAGPVQQRARDALGEFFHPLRGGPERRGWEPGRAVYRSDVASVLERVTGIDYVEALTLSLPPKPPSTERVEVPYDHIVVAGEIRLTVRQAVSVNHADTIAKS
jgi:uncharacterized phage protein gp47/JayE